MPNGVYSDFIVRARDQFTRPMRNMQRQTTLFSRNAQRSLGGVSRSFDRVRNMARVASGVLVTGLVGRGIAGLVRAASDVEGVTTQFETLTGSMESANQLVTDMQKFAASTPLQFDTLAQGTQRLMAFGVEQENVLDTLQMLGDAAMGDANKLDSLTRAFGKVQARGRASMEEVNMVIDAGVPIMDSLNEVLGTNTEQLSEMMRAGEISADVFQQAFQRMTMAGGQFHNGMQRQSQTTAGLFSTLKDNLQLTAASIGAALLPTVKDLTENLIEVSGRVREWVNENQDLIRQRVEDVLQGIADTVRLIGRLWENGTIPAIIAAVATFKTLNAAVLTGKALMIAYKNSQIAATGAAAAFNAVIKANPLVLIISAVAALVAGLVLLIKNWDKLKAAMQRFADWVAGIFKPILDGVNNAVEKVANFLGISNSRNMEDGRARNAERYGMTAENYAVSSARAGVTNENRSTVDVNFNNLPSGATVRQRGRAPGVSMRTGYRMAGLGAR